MRAVTRGKAMLLGYQLWLLSAPRSKHWLAFIWGVPCFSSWSPPNGIKPNQTIPRNEGWVWSRWMFPKQIFGLILSVLPAYPQDLNWGPGPAWGVQHDGEKWRMFTTTFDFWSSTLHQYPCIGRVLVVVQKLQALTLTTPTSPNLFSCALSLEKPGGWADDGQCCLFF